MKRVGGLMGGKSSNAASRSLTALDEPHALQDAMLSATHIMNDEVEQAEEELSKGTSPFHKLGRALALFLRATLGFEKEIMEQAAARLGEAEESAAEHQRRAIRDPTSAHQSRIYPAGSEYALCHAESQLMACVVAVLNENLTESLKGFYKLRTAFATLSKIHDAELKFLKTRRKKAKSAPAAPPKLVTGVETPAESSGVLTPVTPLLKSQDDDDDVPKDSEDGTMASGHADMPDLSDLKMDEAVIAMLNGSATEPMMPPVINTNATKAMADAEEEVDFRTFTSEPIDLFIHSGTSLCFGMLQLMLSMIPPGFAKVLSLFSFRGDRDAGLRMIWTATKFKDNINGAMAGLMTLGFHSAAIGFCDIKRTEAMPYERLRRLLQEMRQAYPRSKLWLLEEARMHGEDRRLEQAVQTVTEGEKSTLRQVEAMSTFEAAFYYLYLDRLEECAEAFIKCVGLNSWSHALYYYIAGASYVGLYRSHKTTDPEKAKHYAAKADKYLHLVPTNMGKKRILGRQLPFDLYVLRKINKWDARAKARKCAFVDAVGVSPVDEMAYFWSGYKRMDAAQLQASLKRLAWSDDPATNPSWKREPADEKAILHVLRGTIQRFMGQTAEAKVTFRKHVLCHDLARIKACEHADTWALPVAHYEIAVCLWAEAPGQDGDRVKLRQCSGWIAKVEKWEPFDLDTRVGLKIATARETLKRCGVE